MTHGAMAPPRTCSPPPCYHVCCVGSCCSSVLHFFPSITFTLFFFSVPFSSRLPPTPFLSFCLPLYHVSRTLLPCIHSIACSSSPFHFEPAHFFFLSFPSFVLCFHPPPTPPPHPPLSFGMYCRGGVADASLPGFWGAAGVCNDHGKTYALYTITVFRRNQDGSEDCWKTYRRYSDFHDFHMRITEQVRACA